MADYQSLVEQIAKLAEYRSNEQLLIISDSLEQLRENPTSEAISEYLRSISHADTRSVLARLIGYSGSGEGSVSPEVVALCIRVLVAERQRHTSAKSIELVWTGPTRPLVTMRRTDQALTDLIRDAKESLIIVSFVVYKVSHIVDAIEKAIGRGVHVSLVFESEEDSQGKVWIDGFDQMGSHHLLGASQYVWPLRCRGKSADGHVGSLHAKCAVADRTKAFISSANLTDYGLSLNMELGLLIEGGTIPERIMSHFEYLISSGTLVRRG